MVAALLLLAGCGGGGGGSRARLEPGLYLAPEGVRVQVEADGSMLLYVPGEGCQPVDGWADVQDLDRLGGHRPYAWAQVRLE